MNYEPPASWYEPETVKIQFHECARGKNLIEEKMNKLDFKCYECGKTCEWNNKELKFYCKNCDVLIEHDYNEFEYFCEYYYYADDL